MKTINPRTKLLSDISQCTQYVLGFVRAKKMAMTIQDAIIRADWGSTDDTPSPASVDPIFFHKVYQAIQRRVKFETDSHIRGKVLPAGPDNDLMGKYLFVENGSRTNKWHGGNYAATTKRKPDGTKLGSYVVYRTALDAALRSGITIPPLLDADNVLKIASQTKGSTFDRDAELAKRTEAVKILAKKQSELQQTIEQKDSELKLLKANIASEISSQLALLGLTTAVTQ